MVDIVNEITICRHCGKAEYVGEMRWSNGRCMCRDCYKSYYEDYYRQAYKWDDLNGKRPTLEEYEEQRRDENAKI